MTRTIMTLIAAALFLAAPAVAQDEIQGFDVVKPYAFATSKMQKTGAVFLKFENHTDEIIKITDVKADDFSENIELHTVVKNGDAVRMQKVDAYEVPAQGSLTLDPTGNHVMLLDLKKQLVAGEALTMSFIDEKGHSVETEVKIIAPGTNLEGDNDHAKQDHHDGHH